MRRLILAALLAAVTPLAAAAQSYRAINDLEVFPLDRTTFEVIEARGEGPQGIWCAAAEYAKNRLRTQARIYIIKGRDGARSVAGRKSVVFTTDVASLPAGPFRSISVSTSRVGVGLPVNHALQFCRTDDFDVDEWSAPGN
jgi:hypothetical protein